MNLGDAEELRVAETRQFRQEMAHKVAMGIVSLPDSGFKGDDDAVGVL